MIVVHEVFEFSDNMGGIKVGTPPPTDFELRYNYAMVAAFYLGIGAFVWHAFYLAQRGAVWVVLKLATLAACWYALLVYA